MAGNSIGQIFRVTTFGESHGLALGCIVDGVRQASNSPKPIYSTTLTVVVRAPLATPRSVASRTRSKYSQAFLKAAPPGPVLVC